MDVVGKVFSSQQRYEGAQKLSKLGRGPLGKLPVPGWSAMRELPEVPPRDLPRVVAAPPRTFGRRDERADEVLGARPVCARRRAGRAGRAAGLPRAGHGGRRRRPVLRARGGLQGQRPPRHAGDGSAALVAEICAAARRGAAGRHARRSSGLVADDPPLGARELDALDGVITGCALGIAETGTIVLDGGERSGRRALTLVPDLHLCVIEEEQIVAARARRRRPPRRGGARRAPDHAGVGAFGDVPYRARPGGGGSRSAAPGSARRSASAGEHDDEGVDPRAVAGRLDDQEDDAQVEQHRDQPHPPRRRARLPRERPGDREQREDPEADPRRRWPSAGPMLIVDAACGATSPSRRARACAARSTARPWPDRSGARGCRPWKRSRRMTSTSASGISRQAHVERPYSGTCRDPAPRRRVLLVRAGLVVVGARERRAELRAHRDEAVHDDRVLLIVHGETVTSASATSTAGPASERGESRGRVVQTASASGSRRTIAFARVRIVRPPRKPASQHPAPAVDGAPVLERRGERAQEAAARTGAPTSLSCRPGSAGCRPRRAPHRDEPHPATPQLHGYDPDQGDDQRPDHEAEDAGDEDPVVARSCAPGRPPTV